jgi:hypothetical protein
MAYPDYKYDLLAADFDASRMLDRYFHSSQSVAFVNAPPEAEPNFKRKVVVGLHQALGISLHPLRLIMCVIRIGAA